MKGPSGAQEARKDEFKRTVCVEDLSKQCHSNRDRDEFSQVGEVVSIKYSDIDSRATDRTLETAKTAGSLAELFLSNVEPTAHYPGCNYLELQRPREVPKGKFRSSNYMAGNQGSIFRTSCRGAVVKVYNKEGGSEKAERAFRAEAELLSLFDHPNIVTFYGTIDLLDQMDDFGLDNHLTHGLILEACRPRHFGKISFFDDTGRFKALKYIRMVRDIFKGLDAMHCMGVIHCDMKPENILITTRTRVPKICDFGLSIKITEVPSDGTFNGSPGFYAPELFEGHKHSPLNDVWATMISAVCVLSRRSRNSRSYEGPPTTMRDHWMSGGKNAVPDAFDLVSDYWERRIESVIKKMESTLGAEHLIAFRNMARAGICPIYDRLSAAEICKLPFLNTSKIITPLSSS